MQRNMAANAGLGYAGLADLAATIAARELRRLAAFAPAAAGGAAPGTTELPAACSPARRADGEPPAAAGCDHCSEVLAAAAARVAGALAAHVSSSMAPVGAQQMVERMNHGMHCMFKLRRALFVLDAIESHDQGVLSDDAVEPQFATVQRYTRTVLHEFDQALAST